MRHNIFLWVLASSIAAIGIVTLIPHPPVQIEESKLPWNIKINANQQSTVFGLTLDESSLNDARQSFQSDGKISLFAAPDSPFSVEVFFESIALNRLKANIYLTLNISQEEAEQFYKNRNSLESVSEETHQIRISFEDEKSLEHAKISHIIYIPRADLDAELIEKRFGIPQLKVKEDSKAVHWLYPNKGLDIVLNTESREILQYTSPIHFSQVLDPLQPLIQAQGLRP